MKNETFDCKKALIEEMTIILNRYSNEIDVFEMIGILRAFENEALRGLEDSLDEE